MRVIGVVGYPASGKGEFSSAAAEAGIPVVGMGDIVREKTIERGLPLTDANVGETARMLRKEFGMDAVAVLTAEEVKRLSSPAAVIDGIRGDAEIAFFRTVFPDFTVVFVEASFEIRLSRMMCRNRSDDAATAAELSARDAREDSFGLKRAAEAADIRIRNEADCASYRAEVRKILGVVE